MSLSPTSLALKLNQAMAAAGLAYRASFSPAEDESVDDEISFLLAGAPTGIQLQLGPGYIALNEDIYRNGKLFGLRSLKDWDHNCYPVLIPEIVQALCARATQRQAA